MKAIWTGVGIEFAIEKVANDSCYLNLRKGVVTMVATVKSLFDQTAADLMTRKVICLPQEMSMREAARLLILDQISGAPVVDGVGKCVGVISSTDFLAAKHPEGGLHNGCGQCACTEWEVFQVEDLPVESVRKFMTADPVMVPPTTPLGDLEQKMIDAHIHRIIVVDIWKRPIGIVSSTDLLAALANADRIWQGNF